MHPETLHALISLYHGENAAERAYERAARRFVDQPEEPVLQRLALAHAQASDRLAEAIRAAGTVVPEPSGAWEFFAETLESLAAMINDDMALNMLLRGERLGVRSYEKAMTGPYSSQEIQRLLADGLLDCRGHAEDLRTLRSHVLAVQDRPLL